LALSVVGLVILIYFAALAFLYVAQRRLLYLPNVREFAPAEVGLPQAERLHLESDDGERLLAWRIPPSPGAPMIVYFHGNGGGLHQLSNRYAAFAKAGFGVLALEYRGYAGSTGAPSEAGLTLDAEAAYRAALADAPARRIVVVGESLGSGLAVKIASRHEIGALVLDSPFTSIADIAAARFWMFPVRRLLKDRYDSASRIAEVTAPLLVVHHERDLSVPLRFGRRLFAAARAPKDFLLVPGFGHPALDKRLGEAIVWISARLS
jgi:uncharacterized protein